MLVVIIFILFVPTMISYRKKKRNKIPILVLNIIAAIIMTFAFVAAGDMDSSEGLFEGICFLVTLIIWIILLIWSLLYERPILND